MKERQIEHRGIVERIMPHGISVSIVQETACAACAAAQLCNSSDKKEKSVEIRLPNASGYHIGQEVTIVGEIGLGLRATWWAYLVPLILLMTVLIATERFTDSEGLGAVAALISLIPYYTLLYMLRGRLQRRFSFKLKNS